MSSSHEPSSPTKVIKARPGQASRTCEITSCHPNKALLRAVSTPPSLVNLYYFDIHTSSPLPLTVIAMEPGPDDWEDKLEFTFACTGRQNMSPVSADKIFLNGQIRPSYPHKLPGKSDEGSEARSQRRPVVREPLRRLFSREREWNSRWDLYEEDELEGTAPRRYCLWGPRGAQEGNGASNSQKIKKKNVGVSKRWKVKGLVCNHGCKKVSDEPLE